MIPSVSATSTSASTPHPHTPPGHRRRHRRLSAHDVLANVTVYVAVSDRPGRAVASESPSRTPSDQRRRHRHRRRLYAVTGPAGLDHVDDPRGVGGNRDVGAVTTPAAHVAATTPGSAGATDGTRHVRERHRERRRRRRRPTCPPRRHRRRPPDTRPVNVAVTTTDLTRRDTAGTVGRCRRSRRIGNFNVGTVQYPVTHTA